METKEPPLCLQRMYEVPKQDQINFFIGADGTVTLNDDVVSRLDKSDYRDFVKAYARLNLVTQVDPVSGEKINPKPITIKSDGTQVLITQTGINDVAKKIRGAGLKSQDNISSLLLLNRIIEYAYAIGQVENKHGKNVPFTTYRSRFSTGGRTYEVLLHIKNANQGSRYHYHTLNEIEVTPVDGSNGKNTETYQTRITSS